MNKILLVIILLFMSILYLPSFMVKNLNNYSETLQKEFKAVKVIGVLSVVVAVGLLLLSHFKKAPENVMRISFYSVVVVGVSLPALYLCYKWRQECNNELNTDDQDLLHSMMLSSVVVFVAGVVGLVLSVKNRNVKGKVKKNSMNQRNQRERQMALMRSEINDRRNKALESRDLMRGMENKRVRDAEDQRQKTMNKMREINAMSQLEYDAKFK